VRSECHRTGRKQIFCLSAIRHVCQICGQIAAEPHCALFFGALATRSYMQAQCNTGYTGNLCAVCAKDPRLGNGTAYGFSTVFKCTPCRSTAALICLSVLGFFLQFAIITYCVWSNVQINRERYSSGEALSSDFIKVGIQRVQKHHLGPGGGVL
jgi:hypothetical protein